MSKNKAIHLNESYSLYSLPYICGACYSADNIRYTAYPIYVAPAIVRTIFAIQRTLYMWRLLYSADNIRYTAYPIYVAPAIVPTIFKPTHCESPSVRSLVGGRDQVDREPTKQIRVTTMNTVEEYMGARRQVKELYSRKNAIRNKAFQ